MHFSEDDLRGALKRKDPGAEFTSRVMARVAAKKGAAGALLDWLNWVRPLRLFPAMAAAAALIVLTFAGWMAYDRHRQNETARQQEATRQTIRALQITNAKLSHVLKRMKQSEASDPKLRRQL